MTPERLTLIRREEQQNAARELGVERVEFLGYEDAMSLTECVKCT